MKSKLIKKAVNQNKCLFSINKTIVVIYFLVSIQVGDSMIVLITIQSKKAAK